MQKWENYIAASHYDAFRARTGACAACPGMCKGEMSTKMQNCPSSDSQNDAVQVFSHQPVKEA